MKKVLMLAWYFPPRNHIASYRSGCYAKFLPENGWLPTVICEEWTSGHADYDPEFVGEIPKEIRIHGIPNPPPAGFYERFVLRKLGPYFLPHRLPIAWTGRAMAKVAELLKAERFDAVWATAPSLTPLAMAAQIARETGLPWVADIRDSVNAQRTGSWYKRPIFARLEQRLCSEASHVVAVSEGIANHLGGLINRKIEVIPNGFDRTLLPQGSVNPPARFRIVYAGTLLAPHRLDLFLHALQLCITNGSIPRDEIEVAFFGSDPGMVEKAFPGAAKQLPLTFTGRLPHKEILEVLVAGSVLLLLSHRGETGVLTGKVFDYLAAEKPILAVPDDLGETSALLRRTGAGIVLSEVEEIARQLATWYEMWKKGGFDQLKAARNEIEIAKYSRREQTKRLAAILEEVSAHGAGNRR